MGVEEVSEGEVRGDMPWRILSTGANEIDRNNNNKVFLLC